MIFLSQPDKNILRIAVQSLGSPLWPTATSQGEASNSVAHCLNWFLICLRALMRSAFATCLVTVPSHLFEVRIMKCNLFTICPPRS